VSGTKPVIPREQAQRDVEAAIDYYADEAGAAVALDFIDALRSAYHAISRQPGSGSTRFAVELELPGLRSRKLKRLPYLVFYVERSDHLDVWRVLHLRRDVSAQLED